jgi:hypothetical protein
MRIEVTADKPEHMRRALVWAACVCGALPDVTALYIVIVETTAEIDEGYPPDWENYLSDERGWITWHDGALEKTLTRFLEMY